MLTSNRFIPSFGVLASVSRLGLGLLLGLSPSCAMDDGSASEDAVTGDEAVITAELGSDGSSEAICNKGKFRCHARALTTAAGLRITSHASAAAPPGFGAKDLQSAYNVDITKTLATKPTVAIIDAYGYATLEADLGVYRTTYGLPACTKANGCLKVVNQLGLTSPLPGPPPPDDDWTVETALDVDMISALCPACNILVIQADDPGDGMLFGQQIAVQLGATVISDSWGGPEAPPPNDPADAEQYFDHAGVPTFVSAGDAGYNNQFSSNGVGPDYPGTSAHVIAVGGTRLVKDNSARGWSETTWAPVAGNSARGAGGSACSLSIPKPAYQTKSPCQFKATTDIAAVGDPATGLAVYNAGNGWLVIGGTSAAAPMVAAIFAATGNAAQASGEFIASKASKLYDVTSGNNGTCGADTLLCNAAVGWDGPTGYGTPNAVALTPAPPTPSGSNSGGASDGVAQDVTGGCSIAGGAGGAGAGLWLGLALLGLRRRRTAFPRVAGAARPHPHAALPEAPGRASQRA